MADSLLVNLLLLLVGLPMCGTTIIGDHPPILEGQSTVLTCAGNLEEAVGVTLHWSKKDSNGRSTNIAICHLKDGICKNFYTRYTANASFNETNYHTSLVVLNISSTDRSNTFLCKIYYRNKNTVIVDRVWKISTILYPPDAPICTARHIGGTNVSVVCGTIKVYPSIVCELFQIYMGAETPTEPTHLDYAYESSNYISYNTANCSFVTNVSQLGIYKYRIKIFPGFNISDRVDEAVKDIVTNEVRVELLPEVHVHQLSQTICAEQNKTSRFVCTADFLPSAAIIVWSINSIIIGENKTTNTYISSIYYKSESYIDLSEIFPKPEGMIKCEVHYKVDGTNMIFNGTKNMERISPPYFTYIGKPIKLSKLIISQHEILNKFECAVHGGSPPVLEVIVRCQVSNSFNHPIRYFRNRTGESVMFDLIYSNTSDSGVCSCSAQYESGCYALSANFTFTFHRDGNTLALLWKQKLIGSKSIIYYIISGFVVMVSILLLLGTLMFIIKRPKKLDTFTLSKFAPSIHGKPKDDNPFDLTRFDLFDETEDSQNFYESICDVYRNSIISSNSNIFMTFVDQNAENVLAFGSTDKLTPTSSMEISTTSLNKSGDTSNEDGESLVNYLDLSRASLASHSVINSNPVLISNRNVNTRRSINSPNVRRYPITRAYNDEGYLQPGRCRLQSRHHKDKTTIKKRDITVFGMESGGHNVQINEDIPPHKSILRAAKYGHSAILPNVHRTNRRLVPDNYIDPI